MGLSGLLSKPRQAFAVLAFAVFGGAGCGSVRPTPAEAAPHADQFIDLSAIGYEFGDKCGSRSPGNVAASLRRVLSGKDADGDGVLIPFEVGMSPGEFSRFSGDVEAFVGLRDSKCSTDNGKALHKAKLELLLKAGIACEGDCKD